MTKTFMPAVKTDAELKNLQLEGLQQNERFVKIIKADTVDINTIQ